MSHETVEGFDPDRGFEPTVAVFDLEFADKTVFEALVGGTPTVVRVIKPLRKGIPLPKSCAPHVAGRIYRLPNHNRSFCYALNDGELIERSPALVFKGSEPLLRDFQTILDWMTQAPLRKSSRVMSDHFPLSEGKIPGALSMREAMREAEIALEVQRTHLRYYGELARLPTPLLIHCMPRNRTDACKEALRKSLSQAAFDRIEPLIDSGLAVYVYHYPTSPIRSNHWGDLGASMFKAFSARSTDEGGMVKGWVRLFIRLIYLGYLPYSVRNEGLGACMDFGNAALDGGFCDPDSIIAIDESMDNEFFCESVIQGINILQRTIYMALGLSNAATLYPSIEEHVCRQYVLHLMNSAIASEARAGLRIDSRFLKLMSPETIADVRSCASRRSRSTTYAQFQHRFGGDSPEILSVEHYP